MTVGNKFVKCWAFTQQVKCFFRFLTRVTLRYLYMYTCSTKIGNLRSLEIVLWHLNSKIARQFQIYLLNTHTKLVQFVDRVTFVGWSSGEILVFTLLEGLLYP